MTAQTAHPCIEIYPLVVGNIVGFNLHHTLAAAKHSICEYLGLSRPPLQQLCQGASSQPFLCSLPHKHLDATSGPVCDKPYWFQSWLQICAHNYGCNTGFMASQVIWHGPTYWHQVSCSNLFSVTAWVTSGLSATPHQPAVNYQQKVDLLKQCIRLAFKSHTFHTPCIQSSDYKMVIACCWFS